MWTEMILRQQHPSHTEAAWNSTFSNFQVLSSQLTLGSLLAPERSSKKQLVRDALKDPDKWQFSTLQKQLSRPGKANIRVIHILQPLHNHVQSLPSAWPHAVNGWCSGFNSDAPVWQLKEPEQVPTCHQFLHVPSVAQTVLQVPAGLSTTWVGPRALFSQRVIASPTISLYIQL